MGKIKLDKDEPGVHKADYSDTKKRRWFLALFFGAGYRYLLFIKHSVLFTTSCDIYS